MQQQIVVAPRTQMLKAGHVLMCLWPLEAPTPLRRAWCLFELWVALQNDIKLTMCFGKAEAKDLLAAVRAGSFDVNKMVGEIRAQDALATKHEDKQLILGIVENATGIEQFNKDVQDNLLKAMRGTVTALIAQAHTQTRSQTSVKLHKSAEAKGKQQAVPEQVQVQLDI